MAKTRVKPAERSVAPAAPSRRLRVALGVAVAAAAVLVYLNGLSNPFVYDDHETVLLNPSLVDLSNLRFVFLYSLFRPVVNLSYAVDRGLWGFTSFGFHVTNVALHATVVLLFYGLCTRLLADASRGTPLRKPEWPAFFAACAYAVHPLMTEGAGYISGRSEVLCAIGFIACLILARRAILTGSRASAVCAVVAAVFAAGSKETVAALPFVLLACDAWVFGGDGWRRRVSRVYVPAFALLALGAVVRLRSLLSAEHVIARGPLENLLTQAIVVWRYLRLLVSPVGQTIMHRVSFVGASDAAGWLALAGLAAVIVLALRSRRRHPLVAVGAVWFFTALAPSSSVLPLREGMAEHRVYLASGGAFLAAAGALAPVLEASTLARAAGVLVLAVCSWLTIQRNAIWSTATTLWAEAADQAPDMWEPHLAHADALRESGQCAAAVDEYQYVLRLQPAHRDALTNLGICLAQTGQYGEAQRAFKDLIAVYPDWVRGYTNLGALAITQHDYDAARAYYLEAIRHDARNVLARMQLAQLYESVFHDYRAAARMCDEARAIDPRTPDADACAERNWRRVAQGG